MFLILTPYKEPALQLAILKELSGLIMNKTLLKRLFTAKTPDAIMDIFCTFEDKVMD
jgi:mannitol/fructose-specific phosphotransferase system IIA component (Ntr-type)